MSGAIAALAASILGFAASATSLPGTAARFADDYLTDVIDLQARHGEQKTPGRQSGRTQDEQ